MPTATYATEGHEVEEGLDSNAQLWEVSEVRDGLDDEAATEYGFCKSCGNTIGVARLEAMPFATVCIDCAEDSEDNADLEAFDADEY